MHLKRVFDDVHWLVKERVDLFAGLLEHFRDQIARGGGFALACVPASARRRAVAPIAATVMLRHRLAGVRASAALDTRIVHGQIASSVQHRHPSFRIYFLY